MFQHQQQSHISLRDRMGSMAYQMLYNNLLYRLPLREERLDWDFFTGFHSQEPQIVKQYADQPMLYRCPVKVGYVGNTFVECTYLVAAGADRVVLLLEPQEAMARNLPHLSVLVDGFFRPHIGSATEYWQQYIEPVGIRIENENVLGLPPFSRQPQFQFGDVIPMHSDFAESRF